MDTDLKCNRLTCRKALTDKAVVTTCSHIFCVECANELFTAAHLCPACETSLTEPDDVVVCSLHPSNDYKTSVLSGLSPSIILEICSRAISFWQYQIHQEQSFQQAVVRNFNDKNTQLQKQLENVIREANAEISILGNKISELERDLELERRKVRELQEASKERDKEYQRLKNQHDKIRRKALLAPAAHPSGPFGLSNDQVAIDESQLRTRGFGVNVSNAVGLDVVVGGMEANKIQRTPIVNRTAQGHFGQSDNSVWSQQNQQGPSQALTRSTPQRHAFPHLDRSHRSGYVSDQSESANEVENMLIHQTSSRRMNDGGWSAPPSKNRTTQRSQLFLSSQNGLNGPVGFAPATAKRSGTFKPAVRTRI